MGLGTITTCLRLENNHGHGWEKQTLTVGIRQDATGLWCWSHTVCQLQLNTLFDQYYLPI